MHDINLETKNNAILLPWCCLSYSDSMNHFFQNWLSLLKWLQLQGKHAAGHFYETVILQINSLYSTYFTEQREKQENKSGEKIENQEWEIADRQEGGSIPHAEKKKLH